MISSDRLNYSTTRQVVGCSVRFQFHPCDRFPRDIFARSTPPVCVTKLNCTVVFYPGEFATLDRAYLTYPACSCLFQFIPRAFFFRNDRYSREETNKRCQRLHVSIQHNSTYSYYRSIYLVRRCICGRQVSIYMCLLRMDLL